MTDPIDPADPLDELASAHLDGATTPEEDGRIAGDPELQARVAALRAVREAVRSTLPPVDAERREQAIAAALAAFDSPMAEVTPLAEARRSRAQRLRVVGAVAAVALLALLVPTLTRSDDDPDTQTALESRADQDRAATGEALDSTLAAPSGGAGSTGGAAADSAESPELMAVAPPVHLGSFPDVSLLAAAVSAHLAQPALSADSNGAVAGSATSDADQRVDDCLARAGADVPTEQVRFGPGTAELDGRPVVVLATDRGTPEAPDVVVTVRDPADDCSVVATTPLPHPP